MTKINASNVSGAAPARRKYCASEMSDTQYSVSFASFSYVNRIKLNEVRGEERIWCTNNIVSVTMSMNVNGIIKIKVSDTRMIMIEELSTVIAYCHICTYISLFYWVSILLSISYIPIYRYILGRWMHYVGLIISAQPTPIRDRSISKHERTTFLPARTHAVRNINCEWKNIFVIF